MLSTRPTLRLPVAALALAIGLALLLPVTAFAWGSNAFSSTSEQQLFQLTNQARAAAGRKALHWDARLATLARARAKDMIVRNYFAHQIPPDGHTVFDVMSNVGYCYNLAGENIGWNNYPDDQATTEIQTMFMNSPDHKAEHPWPGLGRGRDRRLQGPRRQEDVGGRLRRQVRLRGAQASPQAEAQANRETGSGQGQAQADPDRQPVADSIEPALAEPDAAPRSHPQPDCPARRRSRPARWRLPRAARSGSPIRPPGRDSSNRSQRALPACSSATDGARHG